jgi:protein phosphatase
MPLVYRYLWAIGEGVAEIPIDTVIAGRYLVQAPQIWLDTKPGTVPDLPDVLPGQILPYLHLYPHRLHVPELHGFFSYENLGVLLLDNVPIDETGQLLETLDEVWHSVSAVRQVYWLWQLFQLWQPLRGQGVATSLLTPDNLRVEGWRVRLQVLIGDRVEGGEPIKVAKADLDDTSDPTPTLPPTFPPSESKPKIQAPTLKDLATVWLRWVEQAHPTVQQPLQTLCQQMQSSNDNDTEWQTIAAQLNKLLLEQSARLPFKVEIAGQTDTGPQRAHNEDACYPDSRTAVQTEDRLHPYVGIICDGIGGHDGGEVASQRALDDLKRLDQILLNEFHSQTELTFPTEVGQHLESIVRIVNNVIARQNDEQGRSLRQRMGTTLVMAMQLPQKIETAAGFRNAHELYLVHVGDSRAYWLTPRYCHQLTVDDDVATREVRLGRSVYQEALERPDGGALTQAIGTRNADTLQPTVQRFLIEEDGLLLLCSDGLSDNDRVEQSWKPITQAVFDGKLSLEEAVRSWIGIANAQNGHDNTSVVMMRFWVGSAPVLPETDRTGSESEPTAPDLDAQNLSPPPSDDLTEASRALLYDDDLSGFDPPAHSPFSDSPFDKPPSPQRNWWLGVAAALIAGLLSFFVWQFIASDSPRSDPNPSSPTGTSTPE